MTTSASLLRDLQAGVKQLPISKSLANWDRKLDPAAVERVHQQKLRDMNGDRHSGEGRLRGSLLGSPCQREQILSYRGYLGADSDEAGEDLMKDGTYRHYLWQEAGLSAGFLSDIEHRTAYPPWLFEGQLDGLMAPTDDWPGKGGFELKTTKWDYFKQVKDSGTPLHKDLLQIGGYFKAMDLDWFSVVYEVRGFRIEHVELMVENTPALRIQVEANFGGLRTWIDKEELPPPLPDYPANKRCAYWCGYTKICPVAEW
jgi:hypothetical protein